MELYARVRHLYRIESMIVREALREFGLDRKAVRNILAVLVPSGYRLSESLRRPKLDPFTGIIEWILEDDRTNHRKQRHTAKPHLRPSPVSVKDKAAVSVLRTLIE